MIGDDLRMRQSNVAVMPGFFTDSGNFRFVLGITENKAELIGAFPHPIRQGAGEIRTDQILILAGDAQVDGQSGMVFAGPDFGDELMRVIPAPFVFSFGHDGSLLVITAPAADERHFRFPAAMRDPVI